MYVQQEGVMTRRNWRLSTILINSMSDWPRSHFIWSAKNVGHTQERSLLFLYGPSARRWPIHIYILLLIPTFLYLLHCYWWIPNTPLWPRSSVAPGGSESVFGSMQARLALGNIG